MAIGYWNGEQIVTTQLVRKNLGLDAYLVCPGPSMAQATFVDMRGPGRFVLGINTSFPCVIPDMWIGMDRPESYDMSLWRYPFPKLMGSLYKDDVFHGIALKELPNVHFIGGVKGEVVEILMRRDPTSELLWVENTFWTALHALILMGAKRIHLVGVDLGGGKDYHDNRVLNGKQRALNQGKHQHILDTMPSLVAIARKMDGIEFVSCSPTSPLNQCMPYKPLTECLGESEARNADKYPSGGGVLPGDLANLCRWARPTETTEGKGVVVACNQAQEWILPWWLANYLQHNSHPVAFADLGMSQQMRKWCESKGTLITFPTRISNPFYGKVMSILHSPFRKTLWCDNDVEIRGPVDEWFNNLNEVMVCEDPFSPWKSNDQPINSGMLSVVHGDDAIQRWMEIMLRLNSKEDQSCLNMLWAQRRDLFCLLPSTMNWLRLMGSPPKDAIAVHWTGPVGKDEIKRQIDAATKPVAKKTPKRTVAKPKKKAARKKR
jgi:hypothetical protein